MPELPEVETTRRGIEPYLLHRRVTAVRVHDPRLRWPVPADLAARLTGQRIDRLERRGKYLVLHTANGYALLHLGMSGSLRVVLDAAPRRTHDHVELEIDNGACIRFHDPRRFGAVLWGEGDPQRHELLRELGPEPLGPDFDGAYLYRRSRGRRSSIKHFLMDAHIVVGVGNIYANEALFATGIHPLRAAGRVSRARCDALADGVRRILAHAIERGGTTLRDYVNSSGEPGYFSLELAVYGRDGQPCSRCGAPVRMVRSAQRGTWFCAACQR